MDGKQIPMANHTAEKKEFVAADGAPPTKCGNFYRVATLSTRMKYQRRLSICVESATFVIPTPTTYTFLRSAILITAGHVM